MHKFLFLMATIIICQLGNAQTSTFSGSGGSISTKGGVMIDSFPVTVTNIGAINGTTFGLTSVSLNLSMPVDSVQEIYIKSSANATDSVFLYLRPIDRTVNGVLANNNFNDTFINTSLNPIWTSTAPFNGNFLPDGMMGLLNDGRVADGTWKLFIKTNNPKTGGVSGGIVNSWSLTFSNKPAENVAINKSPQSQPSKLCDQAPLICNFEGYPGSTNAGLNISPILKKKIENDATCSGIIHNNSFIKFIAGGTTVSFDLYVYNSRFNKQGIQMWIVDGTAVCGTTGAVKMYPDNSGGACIGGFDGIAPGYITPTTYKANKLTRGNTYYIVFDGSDDDFCDFIIKPSPGSSSVQPSISLTPQNAVVCLGNSITLNTTINAGTPTWTANPVTASGALNTTSGSSVTFTASASNTPPTTSPYTITATLSGATVGTCPATAQSNITVVESPSFTAQPSTTSYTYSGTAFPALSVTVSPATGIFYQWYVNTTAANSGGTAIAGATTNTYTPPITSFGTYYYYCVITNNSCSQTSNVSGAYTRIPLGACTTPDVFEFVQQPSDVAQSVAMSPAVTVRAYCSTTGSTATGYTGQVKITALNGCGFVALTQNAASGIATFSNVVFTRSLQTGVSLVATADAPLSGTIASNTFNVTAPTNGGGTPQVVEIKNENFKKYKTKPNWHFTLNPAAGTNDDSVGVVTYYYDTSCLVKACLSDNSSGSNESTSNIIFDNVTSLNTYSNLVFNFQIAALNTNGDPIKTTAKGKSNGDGMDGGDSLNVYVSRDKGKNWISILEYDGTGRGDEFIKFTDGALTTLSTATTTSLSFRVDGSKSKFKLNIPSGTTDFMVKFVAIDNRKAEHWAITNLVLTGKTTPSVPATPSPLPTLTVSGNATICSGSAATLSSFASNTLGTVTYAWSPAAALQDATAANPLTKALSNAQSYSLTTTDADGCTATAGPVNISMFRKPVLNSQPTPTQVDVCMNGTVDTIKVDATGSESYQWFMNTTNSSIGGTAISIDGNSDVYVPPTDKVGTYYYYCVIGSNCSSLNVTTNIFGPYLVHALPTVTAPAAVCIGKTVTLTPVSGGTWVSSDPTLASVTNLGVVTGIVAGLPTFTFKESVNGCSATTTPITVNALPTISVVATDNTVCAGVSSTLTASGADTYSWQGVTPTTASQVTVTPAATTTYTVTGTSSATSCSNTGSITITTGASATASVAIAAIPSGIVCAGTSVKYKATPTSGGSAPTYQWYKGLVALTAATTVDSFTYIPVDNDVITCKMVSNSACVTKPTVTSTAITQRVAPIPNIVITNPATVCNPSDANITASAITAGSTAGLTFTYWKEPAAITAYSTPSAAGAGTYYIKGTSSAGCFALKPVVVTVEALPTLSITTPAAVCSPSTVDITLASVTNGSTAGLTYSYWKDISATTTPYATPAAADGGTYYIKGTTAAGCTAVKPVTVTVNALPNLSITNPSAVCSPSKVDITDASVIAGSATGLTYTFWKDINATTIYNTPSAATNGTYYIKGTSVTGCATTKSVTVTVNAGPTAYKVTGGGNFCSGSTGFDVGLSSSQLGVDYQLQIDGADFGTAIAGTGTAITYSKQSTVGSYTVVATNSSTGCVENMTGNVSIIKTSVLALSINTSVSKSTFCLRDNTTFTATASNAGTSPTYEWTVNGVTAQANTSNTFSSKSLQDKDTVKCILRSTADCLVKDTAISAPIVVTVNTVPIVPAITLVGVNPICSGVTTSLTNASAVKGTWSSNTVSIATVDQTGLVTGVGNGSANISYSVTNTCGTTTKSYLITVSSKKVVAAIAGDTIVCKVLTSALSDATKGGVWSSSNPSVASVSKDGLVSALTTGQSTISYTVSGSCVANIPTRIVKVVGVTPKVTFKPVQPTCLYPAIGSISVTDVKGGEGPYQCIYNGTSYPIPFSIGNLAENIYSVNITNQYGCVVDSATINNYLLKLFDDGNCDTLYVPTCYVPGYKNAYSQTQYFKPLGGSTLQVKSIDFKVYNRLGNLVFETHDLYNGWNGTFNGAEQVTGTYVWYLTYTLSNGNNKPIEQKGTFVLIR